MRLLVELSGLFMMLSGLVGVLYTANRWLIAIDAIDSARLRGVMAMTIGSGVIFLGGVIAVLGGVLW